MVLTDPSLSFPLYFFSCRFKVQFYWKKEKLLTSQHKNVYKLLDSTGKITFSRFVRSLQQIFDVKHWSHFFATLTFFHKLILCASYIFIPNFPGTMTNAVDHSTGQSTRRGSMSGSSSSSKTKLLITKVCIRFTRDSRRLRI